MADLTLLDRSSPTSASFTVAIVSLRPALHRFALRLTRDHAAAEDLVQDTLIRAWAARSRFELDSNMRAWVFRIARNSFVSTLRRTRPQVTWNPDLHHHRSIQPATQHDALYARDLRIALSRLPATYREAFLLVAREGTPHAEAAAMLGLPLGTLNSRVARARAAMLAFVEGDVRPSTVALGRAEAVPGTRSGSRSGAQEKRSYAAWKASGGTTIG